MQGSAVAPNFNDRPRYTAPAPALLGFDETILGYCSHLVGLDFDGGDLNTELAERCVRANKNVLRLLEYANRLSHTSDPVHRNDARTRFTVHTTRPTISCNREPSTRESSAP